MFVSFVLQFLDQLKEHKNLISCDIKLLDEIRVRFSLLKGNEEVAPDDLQFLIKCFAVRWQEIITISDFANIPVGVNKIWIELAKQLSLTTGKNYLNIVIPDSTNTFARLVLQIIKQLEEHGNLISCDVRLLSEIKVRFSQKNRQVTSEDLDFLIKCFAERWHEVFDTLLDYTLTPIGPNKIWIEFAKLLSIVTGRSHVNILIPNITNTIDFNNLSLISETVRLENLYLGENGNTVYRKRGLCEHLKNTNYKLSTCRDIHTRKLSPMSIAELSRLRMCKQPNGEFSVDDEDFSNFWDFLAKRSFVRLQTSGQLDRVLLELFSSLISDYFKFKDNNAPYSLFREKYLQFLKVLLSNDLDNVNYFYGIVIQYNGDNYYLFELLILMHQAQGFVLNDLMKTLDSYFKTVDLKHQKEEKSAVLQKIEPKEFLDLEQNTTRYHCLSLILSLFTNKFTVFPLFGQTINLWDRTNVVFSGAVDIYSKLSSPLEQNNETELLVVYKNIIEQIIIPANSCTGLSGWIPRFGSTSAWYLHVQHERLHLINVHVFEPEVILHGLVQLNQASCEIRTLINSCLDELIHTYTQQHNSFLKTLRANICFSEFLNALDKDKQSSMINYVRSQDRDIARNQFINNCNLYISRRMTQICVGFNKSINFFPNITLPVFQISHERIEHVSGIVEAFKKQLSGHKFDAKISEALQEFLMNLSRPILTVLEKEEAAKSVRTLDYLNAPT